MENNLKPPNLVTAQLTELLESYTPPTGACMGEYSGSGAAVKAVIGRLGVTLENADAGFGRVRHTVAAIGACAIEGYVITRKPRPPEGSNVRYTYSVYLDAGMAMKISAVATRALLMLDAGPAQRGVSQPGLLVVNEPRTAWNDAPGILWPDDTVRRQVAAASQRAAMAAALTSGLQGAVQHRPDCASVQVQCSERLLPGEVSVLEAVLTDAFAGHGTASKHAYTAANIYQGLSARRMVSLRDLEGLMVERDAAEAQFKAEWAKLGEALWNR